MASLRTTLSHAFKKALGDALDRHLRGGGRRKPSQRQGDRPLRPRARTVPPVVGDAYPGDFSGRLEMVYSPVPGTEPDPGEVVWTWVPFEEDHHRGKDRPVLLIARDGDWLLGLPLTSKDHDRDAAQEAGAGRYWVDVGTGPWDTRGRPSEARVDRIIRVNPNSVRRIGGQVSEQVFAEVAREVRARRRS
ncbi:type II toxin-antitoxin system PemK/MazF family toxin [Tessaracoccus sp. SD287]|uniref:type II toxin-antitoxin system PemK/MazF family toxin n=1 Tax=Tessaracoccus sp. SD287 TaxID=2782008 RepID=UPI001A96AE3B|nr:type II toxin-antitoxin system PemK/MazF family toxin [Tessaracoccus sp. SD287]MBO1032377.1 type II toxin-antitoxin system PemK/MazF family toxin [Tessaracoccus sp. SD287]